MYFKPNLTITENITAVHLGFSNRLHNCGACRNGVVPLTGMMKKINLILALSSTGNDISGYDISH